MKEIVAVQDLAVGSFICELDRPWLESPFLIQGFLVADETILAEVRSLCRFVYVDRARSVGVEWRPDTVTPAGDADVRAARLAEFHVPAADARRRPQDFFALLRAMRERKADDANADERTCEPFVYRYPDRPERARSGSVAEPSADASPAGRVSRPIVTPTGDGKRTGARRAAGGEEGASPSGAAANAGLVYGGPAVEEEIVAAAPLVDEAQVILKEIARDVQSNLNPDLERLRAVVGEMVLSVARNPDALLWLVRLKQTDQYSYDHSLDVAAHVMIYARHLALPEDVIATLGIAGMLQDVGKLRMPVRLLQKVGAITRTEYEIFKTHVDFSVQILAANPNASPLLLEIVGQHHERCDGSGYPRGLKDEQISLAAQIAGLCDVYCAMTRNRPYGKAASSQAALDELRAMRGRGFAETTVDQFVQCIGIYPVGTLVELNSGEVAVVIAQNRVRRLKPRVMLLLGPDKKPNAYPLVVDLLYDPPNLAGDPYAIVRSLPPGAYGVDPSEYYLA